MTEMLGEIALSETQKSVRFVRDYPTTVQDLWEAVSTPERVSRWFARVEGAFAVGQPFVLHFDGDHTAQFEVVACEPPRMAQVHWKDGDSRTTVTVEVSAVGDRARLELLHEDLSAEQLPEYSTGWHWHLADLTAEYAGTEKQEVWDELKAAYEKRVSALV